MNIYFFKFPNALKYMMIHELCEVQASSGLGQAIARDRSSPGQA